MIRTLLRVVLGALSLTLPLAAQTAPYFVDPGAVEPLPTSFGDVTQYGSWEGPFDWHDQIVPDDPPPGHLELGHATLIVTGPHRGKVLMWNWDFAIGPDPNWTGEGPAPPINLPTTRSWLFDPERPEELLPVETSLADDVFCAGHCVMADGRVFVAGGLQAWIPPSAAPRAIYLFDPLQPVEGEPGPWIDLDITMAAARYYPSAMPLLRGWGGNAIVFGGTASISTNAGIPTLERWAGGLDVAITTPAATGGSFPRAWEYYPRAYQISDGRIFVAADVQYAENQFFAGVNTHPGDAFFITLPTSGLEGATVARATPPWAHRPAPPAWPGPPTSGAASTYFDREYAPCVLMHRLPELGGLDRVLVFGGREGSDAVDGGQTFVHPHYRVRYHRSVQEFDPAGAAPSTAGAWHDKTALLQRRHFANATVLPTGWIFVDGGLWAGREQRTPDPENPGFALAGAVAYDRPAVVPELYEPGNQRGAPGGVKWAAPPNPGVPGHGHENDHEIPVSPLFPWTPRGYHHTSMLLPDGRVFIAGGEDFGHAGHLDPATLPAEGGHAYAGSAHTGEIYAPPYMHLGWRPRIVRAPDVVRFGDRMTVQVFSTRFGTVDRFVLIRPGAITHHFSPDQRYIELTAVKRTGTFPGREEWYVEAPSAMLAPPGHYMLFAVQQSGGDRVPSEAVFLQLR